MNESWKDVATALAARMQHHAYCPSGHKPLDPDCPFCADLEAYRRYQEKVKCSIVTGKR